MNYVKRKEIKEVEIMRLDKLLKMFYIFKLDLSIIAYLENYEFL